MADFEEKYFDVLQNIEFAIVNIYRSDAVLSDYDVNKILELLIAEYQSERSKNTKKKPNLTPLQEGLFNSVRQMCDWRLGRIKIAGRKKQPQLEASESKSVDEIIACLKRIRKSVEVWNKRGGQRGYLQYIDQFLQ